jgi:hypothetical protein
MQLRNGKTIASGLNFVAAASNATTTLLFDPIKGVIIDTTAVPSASTASLNQQEPTAVPSASTASLNQQEQLQKNKIALLTGLVKLAENGTPIEKMLKISLIYDIILADKTFQIYSEHEYIMKIVRTEASKHMKSITSDYIKSLLVTEQLICAHEHFRCLLEKFIDGSFGTPDDYLDYSYHYDIMKKIEYEAALYKKDDISEYAHHVDYDLDLVGDYIKNEVTVYELYAMVTYNTFEALPNWVNYEYCFNEVLSWFYRDKRD